MQKRRAKFIGELLVEEGLITASQLERGLARQRQLNKKLAATLVEMGYFTESDFARFLSGQRGVPCISLSCCDIDPELARLIPGEVALRLEMVPVDRLGTLLTVAMVCPLDHAAIEEVSLMTGLRVKPVLSGASELRNWLGRLYGAVPDVIEVEYKDFFGTSPEPARPSRRISQPEKAALPAEPGPVRIRSVFSWPSPAEAI
jgi:hypothetical protein